MSQSPSRPALLGTALALALTPALAACGGNSTPSGSGGGNTPAASPTSAASAGSTTVTVDETEFKISLSQTTFHPGTYEFSIANKGKFPHNIVINGPGVTNQKIPSGSPVAAGGSTTGTVTLQAGSYEIYCGVPTHKEKGMDLTIQVS